MKSILEKLALARTFVKSHPIKKDGKNTFSNYDYFTPEIVGKMVTDACIETNIICVFDLLKDELGYYGKVTTTDLESGEQLVTIMRTEKPVIKATNETQQMGGMNTYTKRYCLMSLFDIEDNSMDFDSDASKQQPKKANGNESTKQTSETDKPWLNEKMPEYAGAIAKRSTADVMRKYFKVSKEIAAKLDANAKLKPVNN